MSDNLKDILSNLSADIDQETLLLYLNGQLSEEKRHEVEKKLLENEFAGDALEGLQQYKNSEKLNSVVDQLNHDLKKKLHKKKEKKKEKIHLKEHPWIYLAVFIVIILIVISYFVIHKLLQNE